MGAVEMLRIIFAEMPTPSGARYAPALGGPSSPADPKHETALRVQQQWQAHIASIGPSHTEAEMLEAAAVGTAKITEAVGPGGIFSAGLPTADSGSAAQGGCPLQMQHAPSQASDVSVQPQQLEVPPRSTSPVLDPRLSPAVQRLAALLEDRTGSCMLHVSPHVPVGMRRLSVWCLRRYAKERKLHLVHSGHGSYVYQVR